MGGPGSGNKAKGKPRPRDKARKERRCLRCGTMFMSRDAGHRICNGCKGRQDHGDSGIPVASVNVGIPEE